MLVLLLSVYLMTWLPSIIWLYLHTPLCRSDSIYSACLSLEDKDKKQKGFNRQGRSGFSGQCRPFFFLSPPYSLGFWHIETIEQDKIYRERPTISELFLRHPAEWPWRETCCGITRWENISSGKRKTTKSISPTARSDREKWTVLRIEFVFFFLPYVLWLFRSIFFALLFRRRKRVGCRAISKYCGCLRFPRLTSPSLNIQPFFRISLAFFIYLRLFFQPLTFFVFHITLQLVLHLLFPPPRG